MTICVATLMPFRTQNILHKNGVYYGTNPLSKKLLTVNRDNLINQNSFVLGAPGSGKSFITKAEIMSLVLRGDTDVIIIDPESEYGSLVKAMGGELIVLDAARDVHINALDLTAEYSREESNPIAVKSDFLMSLISRINGGDLAPEQRSIIDRCLKRVYGPYIKGGYKGDPPTLVEFKQELEQQKDPVAQRLAVAIEYFVSGSANLFAQQSNRDVNSTLVCYDILNLGTQLKPLAMLITLDSIFNRMAKNRYLGRKTAIFIDEIYLLFQDPYSEEYLKTLWKRCRKYGARMTGITQNIEDLLVSDSARKMLNTSEFLILLSQSGTDRAELAKLLNISPVQMPFISTGQFGEGLLKVGKAIVPFENKFRQDTQIYKLLTSKMTDLYPEDLTQIMVEEASDESSASLTDDETEPVQEAYEEASESAPEASEPEVSTDAYEPGTAQEVITEPSEAYPAEQAESYPVNDNPLLKRDYNFIEAQEPDVVPEPYSEVPSETTEPVPVDIPADDTPPSVEELLAEDTTPSVDDLLGDV